MKKFKLNEKILNIIKDYKYKIIKNKENNEFFKGFINGFYNNDVPTYFNKQLIFITILNFIEHTIEFSETKNEEFITDYVSKINHIFNSVDLFSDDNILDNTKIFLKRKSV